MKSLNQLTDNDAREILASLFPNEDIMFDSIILEPIIENNSFQITFTGQPVMYCIKYRFGFNLDGACVFLDHPMVIDWLNKNNFDTKQLVG